MLKNILSVRRFLSFFNSILLATKKEISKLKITERPVYLCVFMIACVCLLSRAIPFSLFLYAASCFLYLKVFFKYKNNSVKTMWVGYLVLIFIICLIPGRLIAKDSEKPDAILGFGDFIKQSFFFFGIIFSAVFFVHILSFIKPKCRLTSLFVRILSFTLLLLPCLLPLCYIVNWSFGNPVLSEDAILAFYQTDLLEASSYCISFVKPGRLLIVLVCLLVLISLAFALSKTSSAHNFSIFYRSKEFPIFIILIVLGVFLVSHFSVNKVTKPFVNADIMLNEYKLYKQMSSSREDVVKKYINGLVDSKSGTFVLVIGESLSRTHMGCYGYSKETTPWQSSIKNNPNAVFLENAYSNHTHTVPVLTYALTKINQYNGLDLKEAVSIIDAAKYAGGFKTFWISNQGKIGIYETPISSIASTVDTEFYTENNSDDPACSRFDEILVDELKKLDLSSQKNLIVIHLMGNHSAYQSRYPQEFIKFTDDNEIVNSYNNSVYYNDYVLSKIYETVKEIPNFQAMVYFSDHGEDVIRNLGHNSASFTWDMARIPFWTIFSDSYIKENKDRYKSLKENTKKAFTNDLIFDYILGLTGITDSSIYSSKNDISSSDYACFKENLKTLHGNKSLEVLPDLDDMKKIWLHRTDSYKKVLELGNGYSGIEFDCVYHEDMDDFENSHDYSQSVEFYLNDSLKAFVQLKDWQNKKIWIDFKNLTEENKIAAERKLSELFSKYSIKKENCYVESNNWKSLDIFKKNGWQTSYYFPYYELSKLSSSQIDDIKEQTIKISKSGYVSAISFAFAYYDFIKTLETDRSIHLLTWIDYVDRRDFECNEAYFPIIKDPRIKAILVKEFGHYHR